MARGSNAGANTMLRRVQTRSESLLEAATNIALGFVLALIIQLMVYPLFGIHSTLMTDTMIALIFTAASFARSYLVRRAFEMAGRDSGAALFPIIKGRE
jgi:hypothetical protein